MKWIHSQTMSQWEYGVDTTLLITDTVGMDIDLWADNVTVMNPLSVIPPYDRLDSQKTSRCADLARSRISVIKVGVVVAGRSDVERVEFFLWAQEQGYSPIVILPHRTHTRERQIMELAIPKYIKDTTWVHLPIPIGEFADSVWPGNYTTGEEFTR